MNLNLILRRFKLIILLFTSIVLISCKQNNLEAETNKVMIAVIQKENTPLPPPPPPSEEGWKPNMRADYSGYPKMPVNVLEDLYELDFKNLDGSIPNKYYLIDGDTNDRQEKINITELNKLSDFKISGIESFPPKSRNITKNGIWSFQFSRIYFNKDIDTAVLTLICNNSSSGSEIFLGLIKINGEWKIEYSKELLIS